MSWTTLQELKDSLRRSGFERKALLSDDEMARAARLVDEDPRAIETPKEELAFIEGLFNLPLGHLGSFKVIPQAGHEKCRCGRVPSALDVIYTAHAKQIHSRDLIRDTLIGFSNVFEMSDGGRAAECYRCGRTLVFAVYNSKLGYMYA